jgi:hypothetical protein
MTPRYCDGTLKEGISEKEFLLNLLEKIYKSADDKQDFAAILIFTIRRLEDRLISIELRNKFSNLDLREGSYLCTP